MISFHIFLCQTLKFGVCYSSPDSFGSARWRSATRAKGKVFLKLVPAMQTSGLPRHPENSWMLPSCIPDKLELGRSRILGRL